MTDSSRRSPAQRGILNLQRALRLGLTVVTELWNYPAGDWVSSVHAVDIDGDGDVEILITVRDGSIYILTKRGLPKRRVKPAGEWARNIRGIDNAEAVDKTRIVTGLRDGKVQAFDETGEFLWEYQTGHVVRQVRVHDIDHDGKTEILVASEDQHVYALASETGEALWKYRAGSWVHAIHAADVDGDGVTEILAGSGDQSISRATSPAVVSHYNIAPTIDIYATPNGRDLGAVAGDIKQALKSFDRVAPKGVTVTLRGQYATMRTAFSGLTFGLLGAIVLIYLLIVVNFQSWLDPFVIITALPGALAGIIWMLFTTGTTLSVPALTGAIMCMGVATANSILVVSFARERLEATGDGMRAALEAGFTRFRPVLMTALAMIIGMAPMALGLGEGGEQNAALGRAVIGGLVFATCATLMFVPVVFSLVHGRKRAAPAPQPLMPG